MQATLTISSFNHIIVDESTGERWKMIPEEEFKDLNRLRELGNTGNMKWFLSKVDMTENTAKEKILYPFRQELERMVFFPEKKGQLCDFDFSGITGFIVLYDLSIVGQQQKITASIE